MKKNIVIALLLIVSIGSIGYITYDEFIKEEKAIYQECNKEEICDNIDVCKDVSDNYFINLKNSRDYTEIRTGFFIQMLLDKNGSVYYQARPGSKLASSEKTKSYVFNDYITNFGDNHTYTGVKLNISNVLMIYYGQSGQTGEDYFVLIKENGNVAVAVFDGNRNSAEEDFNVELLDFKDNIDGLKNIVSALQNDSYDGFMIDLIDINGNRYSLPDYYSPY